MSFPALDLIAEKLGEALKAQNFSKAKEYADEKGPCVIFTGNEFAYSVLYDEKKKLFQLRSAEMDENSPGEWKVAATWLFDPATDTNSDAENIAEDFCDTVRGPRHMAVLNQKKKRNKNEDGTQNADPVFLFNRFVNIFPDLRDDMTKERIRYGKVRAFTFGRDQVAPRCEALALKYAGTDAFDRMCTVLNDMYANGDMDARSCITMAILNNVSDEAFNAMKDKLSEDLMKNYKFGRRYIGKQVKPEKKKKKSRVVARALDDSKH